MTAPDLGLQSNPPALVIDRCAANRYYRDAIASPQLTEAIELRRRALQIRAELAPVPPMPMPTGPDTDLDAWLELVTQIGELERSRAAKDQALENLIAAQDIRISSVASNTEPALARLHQSISSVMSVAADLVSRLNGHHTASAIVAAGDDGALAAYQDLRRLRHDEYDEVRLAQSWLMVGDPRADQHRSEWLYDDELADDTQLANLDEVFPKWKRHQSDFSMTRTSNQPEPDPRPWPKDKTDQLIWLVTSGAKVWVPTKTELRELGLRRMAQRAHAGGAPSRRPGPRPKQRQQRTLDKRTTNKSELLNKETENQPA